MLTGGAQDEGGEVADDEHDDRTSLRHSFAVGTLLRWFRAGIDPGQRLIHLSTFLGHASPESTAWYLTVTTELLDEANQRFEQFAMPAAQEHA